jgi:hypothetical protein
MSRWSGWKRVFLVPQFSKDPTCCTTKLSIKYFNTVVIVCPSTVIIMYFLMALSGSRPQDSYPHITAIHRINLGRRHSLHSPLLMPRTTRVSGNMTALFIFFGFFFVYDSIRHLSFPHIRPILFFSINTNHYSDFGRSSLSVAFGKLNWSFFFTCHRLALLYLLHYGTLSTSHDIRFDSPVPYYSFTTIYVHDPVYPKPVISSSDSLVGISTFN